MLAALNALQLWLQVYANEDVMVGSWLLGLAVEHVYDGNFCCADTAACDAIALSRGLGASPQLRSLLGGDDGKACALYSGPCNGICGLHEGANWDAVKACARA